MSDRGDDVVEPPAATTMSIGQVAERSGLPASRIRYYEREGLIAAVRNDGGHRRFAPATLRRLAFIRAAQHVGLSLDEIREALAQLPEQRTPTTQDWTRLSRHWRQRLDEEIEALVALRDGLDSCIGCGCLSLERCAIANPADTVARRGPGARYLPRRLRAPEAS